MNPTLSLAEPTELNIICSEYSLTIEPEQDSDEDETVVDIERIVNHPDYDPGTPADLGADLKGPYAGSDIAVYHLTAASKTKLRKKMAPGKLWPACLPKVAYTESRGIFGGWLDQEPFYRTSQGSIGGYQRTYQILKTTQVTNSS